MAASNDPQSFRVVLTGKLTTGMDEPQAIKALSEMVSQPEDVVRGLLGKKTVIKRGLDATSLQRYLKAVRATGFDCFAEIEQKADALSPPNNPSVRSVDKPQVARMDPGVQNNSDTGVGSGRPTTTTPAQPPKPLEVFVTTTVDQFTGVTVEKHKNSVDYNFGEIQNHNTKELLIIYKKGLKRYNFEFRLHRHAGKDGSSRIVFYCPITAFDDYFDAESGGLFVICDEEICKFSYHENKSSTKHMGQFAYGEELGYYSIDRAFLIKIVNAKSVKIRIRGASLSFEPEAEWCAQFKVHCQQFYNNLFDPTFPIDQIGPTRSDRNTGASGAPSIGRNGKQPSVISAILDIFR